MLRRALFALPFVVVLACGSSSTSSSPSGSGDGGLTNEGGGSDGGAGGSTCAITRAYVIRCAGEAELNCGADKYDAWCAGNDQKVNSEVFRRAEAKCLPTVECTADARHACEYASYVTETPTAAQKALVDAYCATCEPSDEAGCAVRAIAYDSAAGPKSVSDIFIAAWELADPLVDEIRTKCTGAALPDGAEPCAERFASCAADPYLSAVPDCP